MASQAGVDLGAVNRQFVPDVPSCHGPAQHGNDGGRSCASMIYYSDNQSVKQQNNISAMQRATSTQSRGTMAQVAQTPSGQETSHLVGPTFSGMLNPDSLPPLLRDAMMTQDSAEGRDMVAWDGVTQRKLRPTGAES